jgi:hypothetical protein
MAKLTTWIGLAVVGGLAAYFLDPRRGRGRRIKARDQAARVARQANQSAGKVSRDLSNRSRGLVAEARSGLSGSGKQVPTDVLVERVRSRMGRLTSTPHSIAVFANQDGTVILKGACLHSELQDLLAGVSTVRGVTGIKDELTAHSSAQDIPELQGSSKALVSTKPKPEHQPPAQRLLLSALGGALVVYGARRHNLAGRGARIAGLGLLSRGLLNRPWGDMGALRRALL